MTSCKESWNRCDVVRHVGPRLIPFFKCAIIYFVAWLPAEYPSLLSLIIKCLPIICLIYFVGTQGITLERTHDYPRRIFVGLIFSCIGDALLIWQDKYFVIAMVAFAIAHISYIRAFNLLTVQPYRWLKSLPFLCGYSCAMYHFYPGLKGILLPGVFVYVLILCGMGWTAVTRLDNVCSWTSLAGCIGANIFIISDTIIGVNEFVGEVPMARVMIMSTYYIAQVLLALSAVNKDNLRIKIKMAEKSSPKVEPTVKQE